MDRYHRIDVNVYNSNIFHTKMMLRNIDLQTYLFTDTLEVYTAEQKDTITQAIQEEMTEIYNGFNVYSKEDHSYGSLV